jgi:hypothetical protein
MTRIVLINLFVLLALIKTVDVALSEEVNNLKESSRYISLREFPPNSNITITSPEYWIERTQNTEIKEYAVHTDNDGFIIENREGSNIRDSIDIIFFGGSTTECLYVDSKKRFPYLVGELLLTNQSERRINSLNCGKSGSHSVHSSLNLIAKGVKQNPKIVVLMHNINDLATLLLTGNYWDSPESRSIIVTREEQQNSQTKMLLKSIKNILFPNIYKRMINKMDESNNDEWKNFRKFKPQINYSRIEQEFEKSILTFIYIAKTHGIEIVLMTQFNRLQPEDDFIRNIFEQSKNKNFIEYADFCKYYQNFNQKIRDIALAEEILLIDLDKNIAKDSIQISDFVHLSNVGSQNTAVSIATEIANYYPEFELKE